MKSGARSGRQQYTDLGKQAAERIQCDSADLFGEFPIRTSRIARQLGIEVHRTDSISSRARVFVSRAKGEGKSFSVYVQRSLSADYARFALAHEIGHVVLHDRYEALAAEMSTSDQEAFANGFAAAILMPVEARNYAKTCLTNARLPSDVLSLSSKLGLPVPALFGSIAQFAEIMDGIADIWIRARLMEHPKSGSGVKLRIERALYDHHRVYLPLYQGLSSCCRPSGWLRLLGVGQVSEKNAVEFVFWRKNSPGSSVKFAKVSERALASAMRLSAFENEPTEMYLLQVTPDRSQQ